MPDRPLLTLTLICKNEAPQITRLLDSAWDWVDEVVIVDTGSTDGTVSTIKKYAAAKKARRGKLKVASFAWVDDFAAARQAADNLATGQWLVWGDGDDEIRGLENLRAMCEQATEDVTAFFCRYSYARDADGNPISQLWRERVVRNNGIQWTGRLHEHKLFEGAGHVIKVEPEVAEWVHHRDHTQRTSSRNLRILEKWVLDEPDDPRVVQSLGMEYMGCDQFQEAADMFSRYLSMPGEPPDRRSQAARHLSYVLMALERPMDARAVAFQALSENWGWADTHLTLAESEQTLGRPDIAFRHAHDALQIGQPDTLLIVNPLQYTAHPHALMAVCLAQMGRFDEAVRAAETALQIAPSYQLAELHLPRFRAGLRRQQALATWLAAADVLVETGELLKARDMLAAVPWFIADEPHLIAKRAEVADLVNQRMGQPAALSEDEAADEFVKRHLDGDREFAGVANL
jgi:tetratricopeptide (TPR) repeat protein